MLVIGFGLAWIGYTLTFWGHSLVQGYNLSFSDIASPTAYYKGAWPPALAPANMIFPDGKPEGSQPGNSGGDTRGKPPPTTVPPVKGKCPPGYDRQSDGTCRLHSRLPL